ncbi:Hpt domain-containing protein, partial [Tahibacter caeni]|uniref:Hpt domain-containing protein n=1 Tax=Tahibacter caeni TaxID=1453545 RepID=UPI0021498274
MTEPIAAPEARAADLSIGQFVSFAETLPEGRKASARGEIEFAAADSGLPSVELDLGGEVDEFVARLGQPAESEPAPPAPEAPAPELPHELEVAVEIAPGDNLDALVVGEHAAPAAAVQDLTGLRLTETMPTQPPAVAEPPAPRFRTIEIEEEIEEEVEDDAVATGAADASFQAVASDDIDEEIREVFVEEVQDEIDNLNRHMPIWKADLNDFERLKPVRRSFHTLKGSGRLVGAMALGEFSWKVENMLNRVLDKTIQPNAAVVTLVDQAVAALPELLAALRGEGTPTADIAGIMAVADKLGAGEEAWLAPARKRTKIVKRKIKRLVEVPVEPEAVVAPVELPAVELTRTLDIEREVVLEPAVAETHDGLPAAGPLPNIDPVLFDILRSEVSQHLAVIDGFVDSSAHSPQVATDTLLRSVHTLHGAIAMVDIPVISHVLAPLEGYVKRLRAREAAPEPSGLAALRDASELVRLVMQSLERGQLELPQSEALIERIVALRDDLPEPELAHTLYVPSDDDVLETLELAAEPVAEPVAEAAAAAAEETIVLAAAEEPAPLELAPQAEPVRGLAEPADEPFTFDLHAPAADDATTLDELSFVLDGSLADGIPSAAVGADAAVQVEEISLEDLAALDFPGLQGEAAAVEEEVSLDSVSLSSDSAAADFDAGVSLDNLFSSDEQAEFDKLLAAVAPADGTAPAVASLATTGFGASGDVDVGELDALLADAARGEAEAAARAEHDAERARAEA